MNSVEYAYLETTQARDALDHALNDLAAAYYKVSIAANALKRANAYVSDECSEATAERLQAVKSHKGATELMLELQGILENVTDHMESLRGEMEAPGTQF